MHAIPASTVPDLAALTASYNESKADHADKTEAWQQAIVECIDRHNMTIKTVARLIGMSESRVHAIIARQYAKADPETLQRAA